MWTTASSLYPQKLLRLRTLPTCKLYSHEVALSLRNGSATVERFSQSIPESERSTEFRRLDLYRDELPAQRALGIRWCVESDTFAFDTCIKPQPATRRGILSVVSSVFDPLGFVSPFVVVTKQALQDLCRIKLGWDDEVPPEYSSSWGEMA